MHTEQYTSTITLPVSLRLMYRLPLYVLRGWRSLYIQADMSIHMSMYMRAERIRD